jgi:hypothetical protein
MFLTRTGDVHATASVLEDVSAFVDFFKIVDVEIFDVDFVCHGPTPPHFR